MNNFKQTELGILPEEWEVVRCIDYCDFERGTEPGSDSYNRYKKGVPFIRVGNISAKIQELVYTTSFKIKLCTEDDILMSFDGSPGVVVKGFRGAYSSGIRKVIPKKFNIDKSFLYFVLQSDYVKNIIEKYTSGVTIKHASKSLPHIKVPLPPLPEQNKIAYVLSSVQKAKEKTESVIDAARALKKSLMKHLFTYGPVPLEDAERVPLKETEIGQVPEEWEVVRCIDYCDFERGTEPGSDSYNRYKKGVPFIRVGNISAKIQELVYTTSFKIKLCTEDDILMSFDGSPGVVVKGFRGAYSSGIRKVIPKRFIDKKFLYFVLQSDYVKNIIEKYTSGVTIKHASKSLPHIKIPLPPLPEQKKISAILSAVDRKIEAEENKKKALEELFKTLLKNLMTAKIRVNHLEVKT